MQNFFQVFSILVAILLLRISAGGHPEEENVLVLNDAALENAIEEFNYLLVEFYLPWCEHCKQLAPEFVTAARLLKEEGIDIRLAKLDAATEILSSRQYGVTGYPTLNLFMNGNAIDYSGRRTALDIVNWVKNKILSSIKEIASTEELAKEIQENDVTVIYWRTDNSEDYKIFEDVSKLIEDGVFVSTMNTQFKIEQNVSDSVQVLMLKKVDNQRNEFSGPLDLTSLYNFIEDQRHPILLPFTKKVGDKIFDRRIPMLILLAKKNEDGKRAEFSLKEAATTLKMKSSYP